MVDAIIWWITLELLGLIAIPLAAVLLRALPDRGYSASKILGLLLTGWLAYTLSMIPILPFTRWALSLCALAVAGVSTWLLYRHGRSLLNELSAHFRTRSMVRYIISAEVLFAVLYIIWAIVRAYQPNIVDQEKFMDFGFLNAILKSGTFPPHDPWLAGYSINYYYFGYVLIAALTGLSGVPTQVAFNLANVTLYSLTALGAFGVVWNLAQSTLLREFGIARRKGERGAARGKKARQAEVASSAAAPRKGTATQAVRPTPAPEPVAPPVPTRRARRSQLEAQPAVAPEESVPEVAPAVATATLDTGEEAAASQTVEHEGDGRPEDGAVPRPPRRTPHAAYLPAQEEREARPVPWFLSPYIYAVLAALMVVAMGNLTVMFAARTPAAGAGTPGQPMPNGNGYSFCFACNTGNGYDWFSPSRIVQDYTTVYSGGQEQKVQVGFPTINEFPAFSFLLADMHPHVLALPLVLLAVSLGLAFARRRVVRASAWRDGIPPGSLPWLSLIIGAIIVGSLYTTNTWDYPTYLLVVLACLVLPYLAAQRRSENPRGWAWLRPWLVQAVLLVVLSLLVFLPFQLTFKSLVGGSSSPVPDNIANVPIVGWLAQKLSALVLINTADKTILGFVVIFGIFLVALLGWLGYEFVALMRRRVETFRDEGGVTYAPYIWAGAYVVLFLLAVLFRFPLLALLLPIGVVALYTAWEEPNRAERDVALILTGLAALIGLVVEVVFLRDNFQMRMNTLFKFYFQIWVLWALAAGYGLWRTLYAAFSAREQRAERGQVVVDTAPTGIKALSGVWAAVFGLLALSGMYYSVIGPMSRQGIFNGGTMKGLDGTTWIKDPQQGNAPGDYDAINWLKANGTGNDAVLEAGSDEYHWVGRVSAYTGVPTLVAWDNSHEDLWRTNQPDLLAQISERRKVVNSIYQGVDPASGSPLNAQSMLDLLHKYSVDYVFVGATERGQTGWAPQGAGQTMTPYAEGLFNQALPVAFRSGNTVVYRVGQGVEGTGQAPSSQPQAAGGTTPSPAGQSTADLNAPPTGLFDMTPAGANRGQFDLPRGIARDAQGNFFVADTQNERIEKFDKDGKFVTMFGSKGADDGQFAPISEDSQGTGPGGVAVDRIGNVYVADTWNHRIQKFDNNGKFIETWGSFLNLSDPKSANEQNKDSRFYGPRGVAISQDGNVYVTDTGNKRVLVFGLNANPKLQISIGAAPDRVAPQYPFDKPGELNEPIGVAVDKSGNVYVADTNNKRIQKFDSSGKYVKGWAMPQGSWEPGPYLEPFLATDGAGNVYATAPTSHSVLKFSPDGQLLGQKNSSGERSLVLPTGITVDDDGTVYVVDTQANGVVNLGKIP